MSGPAPQIEPFRISKESKNLINAVLKIVFLAFLASANPAFASVVKMSNSGICHPPQSSWYDRTKTFQQFDPNRVPSPCFVVDEVALENNLIEGQLKTVALANIKDDYLVTIIDPPFIPEVKSEPSRALICVLITLIGFVFSICISLFFHYFSKQV